MEMPKSILDIVYDVYFEQINGNCKVFGAAWYFMVQHDLLHAR